MICFRFFKGFEELKRNADIFGSVPLIEILPGFLLVTCSGMSINRGWASNKWHHIMKIEP
jgi:hypothetical protein